MGQSSSSRTTTATSQSTLFERVDQPPRSALSLPSSSGSAGPSRRMSLGVERDSALRRQTSFRPLQACQITSTVAGSSGSDHRQSGSEAGPSSLELPTARGSISTALARIDIDEKEEGEISEDEELSPPPQARQGRRRASPPHQPRGKPPPRAPVRIPPRESSRHRVPIHVPQSPRSPSGSASRKLSLEVPRPNAQVASSSSLGLNTRVEVLKSEDKGKAKPLDNDRDSPGPVASAPSDISESEACEYMEIIRNLLHEGFTPDALLRRGATPRYVAAVCEEIVEGTRRRKALWLETREPRDRSGSETPSLVPLSPSRHRRSMSPEVEVSISMTRNQSITSESSAEYVLIERPSPPKPRSAKLVPSSSWTPATPLGVKVESYKSPAPIINIEPASSPTMPPSSSLRAEAATFHTAANSSPSLAPRIAGGPSPKFYQAKTDIINSAPSSTLHVVSSSAPAVVSHAAASMAPTMNLPKISHPSNILPYISAFSQIDKVEKNALLEARKKALLSLRLKRTPVKSEDIAGTATHDPRPIIVTPVASPDDHQQRTIEEEMEELQKEVLNMQKAAEPSGMDVDTAEEGEIIPLVEVAAGPPLQVAPPVFSASLPNMRPVRGVKRPGAEDFENLPITATARVIPPYKRRQRGVPFGGSVPQHPLKLLVHLDESDLDSDEDRITSSGPSGTSSTIATLDTQRLLAEKEEHIRRLKEQIAAKMKARQLKKATALNRASPEASPSPVSDLPIRERSMVIAELVVQESVQQQDAMDIGEIADTAVNVKLAEDSEFLLEELAELGPVPLEPPEETTTEVTSPRLASSAPTRATVQVSPYALPRTRQSGCFEAYQSLFQQYPQLVDLPSLSSAPATRPLPTYRLHQNPDRSLLFAIILTRLLRQQPDLIVCRAESGGGRCADAKCQDLHLDKDLSPTDDDYVDYVSQVQPRAIMLPGDIRTALQAAKGRVSTFPKKKGKKKDKAKQPSPIDGAGESWALILQTLGQILDHGQDQ